MTFVGTVQRFLMIGTVFTGSALSPLHLSGTGWAETEPLCDVSKVYTNASGRIELFDASGSTMTSKPPQTIQFPAPVIAIEGFLVAIPIAMEDEGLVKESIGWLNLVDIEETIPADCLNVLPENYSFVCALGTLGTRGASACQATN